MNPQIKQQPFEKYPKLAEHLEFAANNWTVDTVHWNGLLEEINNVVSGAEYGYNIKESVNHQMLDALKRINDCSLSKQQREIMIENAILSASNQENNEGEKCQHTASERIGETKLWCCNICGKRIENF